MDITAIAILFTLFGLPVVAMAGVILGIGTLWYRYKLSELETRGVEARARVNQARLLAGAPEWLDPNNPGEVEAWKRAHIEVVYAAARAQLQIGEG
jgi:hypothetical protein